jgi:hypothetical protein
MTYKRQMSQIVDEHYSEHHRRMENTTESMKISFYNNDGDLYVGTNWVGKTNHMHNVFSLIYFNYMSHWCTQEFFLQRWVQQIQSRTDGSENGDLGAVVPYSGVPQNFQMSETCILIRLLRMYFPRNRELGLALSKLRNFRGLNPAPHRYATDMSSTCFKLISSSSVGYFCTEHIAFSCMYVMSGC